MKLRALMVFCLAAITALGADATGKWTAEMTGRDGQKMTVTFNLKEDGSALTGTVSGRRGDAEISNGRVNGDTLSFDVVREFNGNSFTQHYTGTLSGDTIQFSIQGNRGPAREMLAKRAGS